MAATLPAAGASQWKLDAAKSDSLEPVMVWMGVGWMQRKAALALPPPVLEITWSSPRLTLVQRGGLTNEYALGETTQHAFADGSKHPAELSVTADALVVRISAKDKGELVTSYALLNGCVRWLAAAAWLEEFDATRVLVAKLLDARAPQPPRGLAQDAKQERQRAFHCGTRLHSLPSPAQAAHCHDCHDRQGR